MTDHTLGLQEEVTMTEQLGNKPEMTSFPVFVLDANKVKTIDDVKRVLMVMNLVFREETPNLFLVKDLCNEQIVTAPKQL